MEGTETITTTEEEKEVNPESEPQDNLNNSNDDGHEDDSQAGEEEDQRPKAFQVPEELTKEGITEGFIKKFYGNDEEIGELSPSSIRMIKSAYSSEKRMREFEAEKQKTAEQQKETEVKQISETVQKNYQTLKSNISQQKATDLQQIEALAEQNGNVTWYDGQVYQVTPDNKHLFREMIAEHYAGTNKELDSAFEMANKQALTKEQQLAIEKSNAGYDKYIESHKETFNKQPELLDAIAFMKKENVAFDEKLVEDFTKLFPSYYEKRIERERKTEKAKLENSEDVNKLTGVSKLPLAGGKTIPKNLSSEQALELSKKDPKAFAEYVKKL